MPTSFTGDQLFNVVLLPLSMFHNSTNYCHRKTDTTPKYAFIQVSCISNEKNRANTKGDDGKVIVFSPSIPTTCIKILHDGCRGCSFSSRPQCRAV